MPFEKSMQIAFDTKPSCHKIGSHKQESWKEKLDITLSAVNSVIVGIADEPVQESWDAQSNSCLLWPLRSS